jgi:hypothetical protein
MLITKKWQWVLCLAISGVGILSACTVKLENVNLERILLQPGDWPAEYRINPPDNLSPKALERMVGIPLPVQGSQMTFEHSDNSEGYARVFLFADINDLNKTFSDLKAANNAGVPSSVKQAWQIQIHTNIDIGEQSLLSTATYPFADAIDDNHVQGYGMAELLFHRCHALVRIQVERRDKRLKHEPSSGSERASTQSATLAREHLLGYAQKLDQRLQKAVCR